MTMLVAMVTPFHTDGSLDAEGAQTLATYLIENQACDGLVLNLLKSAEVLAATGLRYYSGADELNLPLYAIGATGVISTIGHVAGTTTKAMLHAHAQGDTRSATRLHRHLTPMVSAITTKAPGTVAVKALLNDRGLPAGPVRLPLVPADTDLLNHLRQACE